ncbi:hypothetical protein SAMN04487983_103022 [Streptomyces sp. yr375]|uniref:hypothetical protein n=1 Tax=Streptomyces sp. yr375 TaxID=1761906 RepID=UPI0008CBE2AA|nr:hypothetical protein [Streptomyces sp. yr375]SES07021.1 hypothetical protein SAMN04487983_103022 [Streptomyces sp. yr375]
MPGPAAASRGGEPGAGQADDVTRALVRRKPLGDDTDVSRTESATESGTEVAKGTGRPPTMSYAVTVG